MKDSLKDKLRKGTLIGLATIMTATSTACSMGSDKVDNDQEVAIVQKTSEQTAYERLQKLRKSKLPTYVDTYMEEDGTKLKYVYAREQDVLKLSINMADALEDYFESLGAIHWTSDDKKQFWPDDIGYTVTAIAYRESSYRINIVNDKGCQGITCINEEAVMDSLDDWLTTERWGKGINYISFDEDKVDMLNPTTCIEYTYYSIGYHLAHWYKSFNKDRGKSSVWDTIEYSEDLQERLIIATHLFGIGNMEDSIYKRPNQKGNIVPLKDYIYSDYVEDVLAKKQELIHNYKHNLNR